MMVRGTIVGMAKERIEVLGGGRSAVIDDFRRVRLHAGSANRPSRPARPIKDKGHEALLRRFLDFASTGGAPPIPYERLAETTRITLVAREALAEGLADARSKGADHEIGLALDAMASESR